MTATSERNIDPADGTSSDWARLSIFGRTPGIRWWAATLLALGITAATTVVDMLIWSEPGKPGAIFTAGYVVGCLLAVTLVRRGSLFGPMVQPPLILALVLPSTVYLMGSGIQSGASGTQIALAVASPLINAFPTMAATTGLVLAIGLLRILVIQRAPSKKRSSSQPDSDATTAVRADAADARESKSRPKRKESAGPGSPKKSSRERPGRPGAQRGSDERKSRSGGDREGKPSKSERAGAAAERGESRRPGRGGRPRPAGDAERGAPDKEARPRGAGSPGRNDGGKDPANSGEGRGAARRPGKTPPPDRKPKKPEREAPPGRGGQRQAPPPGRPKPPQRPAQGDPPPGRPKRPPRKD